ncbi:MAG TPA: beta/gamma crystallin family protein [Casimicrobiaceae bacterium]
MNVALKALLVAAGLAFAGQAAAQITLFKDDGFQGRAFSSDGPVDNFANSGFNDEASSAQVRGGTWQVCSDAYYHGRCVTLRPGNYPSLGSLGMNDKISSIRPLEQYGRGDERYYGNDERGRYAERPYDRRYDERYYERRWDREGDYGQ